MMWMRRLCALGLALCLLWVPVGSARANSAPMSDFGDLGGLLIPDSSTQIHVTGELLRFELRDGLGEAAVTARYTMENRGGAVSGLPVAFVMFAASGGGAVGPAITWNGAPLAVTEQVVGGINSPDMPVDLAALWDVATPDLDPVTGETYYEGVRGKGGLRFARFALSMPPGGTGVLEVQYTQASAYDRSRYLHPIEHYRYLLLPARHWASFGPLEIRVRVPGEAYWTSNLNFVLENGEYVARYPGLPEENLYFSVMSRSGVMFGWLQPGPYYWMGFGITLLLCGLVGLGLGRLAGRLRSRAVGVAVVVASVFVVVGPLEVGLAALVMSAFPALSDQSYGLIFVALAQGVAGALLTAVVAAVVAVRQSGRRYGVPGN